MGKGSIKVMVVDDHTVVRDGVTSMLNRQEDFAVVGEATSGKEAVEMVQAFPYDLVFMDWQMPVMDGHEATVQIRLQEKPGTHLSIVAMTAHARAEDR